MRVILWIPIGLIALIGSCSIGGILAWRYPDHPVFVPAFLIALANFYVPVTWYVPYGAEGTIFRAMTAIAHGLFVVGAAHIVGRVLSRIIFGKPPELPES